MTNPGDVGVCVVSGLNEDADDPRRMWNNGLVAHYRYTVASGS